MLGGHGHRPPFCVTQRNGRVCAAPTPRDTNNYYNRHHKRDDHDPSRCKGSCYCPEDCHCLKRTMNGRYIESLACEDEEPKCCCCGSGGGGGGASCPPRPNCRPAVGPCSGGRTSKRRSCLPRPRCECGGGAPTREVRCPPPKTCALCSRCDDDDDNGCPPCCPPYSPPRRKPICYPPIKCCETNECGQSPTERICYSPGVTPRNPRYCSCGLANPCDCDLETRRRAAICEMSPCCRRCGRKVYAAEKICAANGAFHSSCFSCYCCHKPLEVTNVYENQGEIYCKQCYTRYFGVSGYGYGSKCACKECVNNC